MDNEQLDAYVTEDGEIRLEVTNTGIAKSKINLVAAQFVMTVDETEELIEMLQRCIGMADERRDL